MLSSNASPISGLAGEAPARARRVAPGPWLAGAFLLAGAIPLAGTFAAHAAEPSEAASLAPGSVSLLPGEEARLLLTLNPPADEPVRAEVRWRLESRCDLALVAPAKRSVTLAPGRPEVIRLTLRAAPTLCSETAYLVLETQNTGEPAKVQLLPIEVASPQLDPASLVQVDQIPAAKADEAEPAPEIFFYWRLRNKARVPLTLRHPEVGNFGAGKFAFAGEAPAGRNFWGWLLRDPPAKSVGAKWCDRSGLAVLSPSESRCSGDFEIPPGGELDLPVTLAASLLDHQNRSTLVLNAKAEYFDQSNLRSVAISEVAPVSVGYQDLKALPAALSIPTLFLLPGLLFLVFLRFAAGKIQLFELALADLVPKILVLAASISIAFAALYYGWLQKNLLAGFSAVDVARTWVISALLGLAAGGLVRFYRWIRQRILEENRPSPSDQPAEILRKAIRNGSDFRLYVPVAKAEFKSWHQSCWFVVAEDENGKWLAPVIEADPGQHGSEALRRDLAALSCRLPFWRRIFHRQKRRLAERLRLAAGRSEVALRWTGSRFPRHQATASFTATTDPGSLRPLDTDLRAFFELRSFNSNALS